MEFSIYSSNVRGTFSDQSRRRKPVVKFFTKKNQSENSGHRPSKIYRYSGMTMRFYGKISRLSSVVFVSRVSREISKENIAI